VTDNEYSHRDVRSAWAVHALTASGVIVGMVGLDAVIDGHARAAILWLVVALLLDGVDGPIARKLDVRNRIPTLNGNALDLIIDYFTCIIVPVAFLDRFNVLPDNTIATSGFVILFVSALWMARTDQETPDGWFRGFPAEWNVVIPTLYLIDASKWFNLAVCAVLCILTLSRVNFPHPISVREQRPISLAFMFLWIGSMTWLAIAQHQITWLRIILIVSPLWTVWQVLNRVRTQNHAAVDVPTAPAA
jgi:phosphatidylcholine synthase